jgi:hypothetical protein
MAEAAELPSMQVSPSNNNIPSLAFSNTARNMRAEFSSLKSAGIGSAAPPGVIPASSSLGKGAPPGRSRRSRRPMP